MYVLSPFFTTRDILNKHKENCFVINGQQEIKMPEKGEKIMFKNYQKQLQAPFVINADFKAIPEKVKSCKPNDAKRWSAKKFIFNKIICHFIGRFWFQKIYFIFLVQLFGFSISKNHLLND